MKEEARKGNREMWKKRRKSQTLKLKSTKQIEEGNKIRVGGWVGLYLLVSSGQVLFENPCQ